MSFLSILFALLLEQLKPLRADNPMYGIIRTLAIRMEAWFNAGQHKNGQLAWFVMVLLLTVPTALIYKLCASISPFLAFAWNIFIVYLTLGFRHYSHYFTAIQLALNAGDEASARVLLAEWTGQVTDDLSSNEISRIAVERALISTHRNVFGVFFWFLMPVGPALAVMYRVAEYLARAWNVPDNMQNEAFGKFAATAFYWIDWIPVRLTAVAFAVVGNFEDAIFAWRNFASRWQDESTGIILSTGGGAMGVRLGAPGQIAAAILNPDPSMPDAAITESDIPPGEESSARSLQSTVGLVWRALLLWMLLLLLLSLAVWVG